MQNTPLTSSIQETVRRQTNSYTWESRYTKGNCAANSLASFLCCHTVRQLGIEWTFNLHKGYTEHCPSSDMTFQKCKHQGWGRGLIWPSLVVWFNRLNWPSMRIPLFLEFTWYFTPYWTCYSGQETGPWCLILSGLPSYHLRCTTGHQSPFAQGLPSDHLPGRIGHQRPFPPGLPSDQLPGRRISHQGPF